MPTLPQSDTSCPDSGRQGTEKRKTGPECFHTTPPEPKPPLAPPFPETSQRTPDGGLSAVKSIGLLVNRQVRRQQQAAFWDGGVEVVARSGCALLGWGGSCPSEGTERSGAQRACSLQCRGPLRASVWAKKNKHIMNFKKRKMYFFFHKDLSRSAGMGGPGQFRGEDNSPGG